jgi:hypothetical protein
MKTLLHNIEQENLDGINASLISLLYGLNNNVERALNKFTVFTHTFPLLYIGREFTFCMTGIQKNEKKRVFTPYLSAGLQDCVFSGFFHSIGYIKYP